MPTKCVQDKIAAYRKKHNRQPNQSIVGEFQRQCYSAKSNRRDLEIKSKKATEAAKKKGGPSY